MCSLHAAAFAFTVASVSRAGMHAHLSWPPRRMCVHTAPLAGQCHDFGNTGLPKTGLASCQPAIEAPAGGRTHSCLGPPQQLDPLDQCISMAARAAAARPRRCHRAACGPEVAAAAAGHANCWCHLLLLTLAEAL